MNPITLHGSSVEQKRQEIKEYFLNTYDLFEKMFELFKNDTTFYEQSESTRHPMIFYFGHTATFFVNKLVNMKIISERINPAFESIFAVGVDEMTWDDVDSQHYKWPSVEETKAYRHDVKELVLTLIETLPLTLPIRWESEMWVILMGIEHEKIHLETSSVLHRQMPLERIENISDFKQCTDYDEAPKNELVLIPSCEVSLGKKHGSDYYGWDNEYGSYSQSVQAFETSKYLVSNAEYMEFVKSGGYENQEFWSEEGREFLRISKAKHPVFWSVENGHYFYRILTSKIQMPMNFPVEVCQLEADAFCAYKSQKDSLEYILPSEAEYEALCQHVGLGEEQHTVDANVNFKYASSTPVDTFNFNGIYDVVGNVWQHSRSHMRPFEGFEVHPAYDDFTVPTFDEKHALILGSSWASTGNLITKHSRYAFRKHFYQHAGFRYVVSQKKEEEMVDIYETDVLVSQYCEFQYGEEHFNVKNFAIECAQVARSLAVNTNKALDLGCATGRATYELAKEFDHVDGIDFSARFVQVGVKLKEEGVIVFTSQEEGTLVTHKKVTMEALGYESIKHKTAFWQGDACNLKPNFTGYDLIMATNLIDRLYQPRLFLDTVDERLNDDGILMITSPYTWQESSTDKEFWLGGYKDENGKEVRTIDTLKEILGVKFELIHTQDLAFVIKETARKFQHTLSHVSVWKKRS
ncbi:5-histidylcysteine sulfoxide synthase [Sulfurimonas sp. SAG-AH-194-I05]|nr:5-histidylcysteine sulfoxide synthase [Sulfurimonas sp. SAG-AH-194-I05]MDF1875580.1 5-histidylcysteine sulfoxide synthase [Sulfurimonas sp. SAG-AH-194-I05]